MDAATYTPLHPHRSRELTLRGLRHHLWCWGPELNEATQPPLVLLHGWMDLGASFQFMVDALPSDRPMLALDWRGFGRSERNGHDSYWFPDYLGDLDALLALISPDRPVDLLGHSMGGNVVMSYAAIRPERVRRLINLEGFGLPDTRPEDAPDRLRLWLDELRQPAVLKPYPSLAAVAQRLMKTNPRLATDKAHWLAAHWAEVRGDGQWHILADPAHKHTNPVLYRSAEVLAGWARIQAPTLWVEGAATALMDWWADRYSREELAHRLAVVPQMRQVILPDAGHMLHHDQPEALAARVRDFLV